MVVVGIEFAEAFSKKSWRTVIPTIRKPGSEIWVSFNPELETDDTCKRSVVSPPPGAVVVKTSWRDNPVLSDELKVEIEHLRATDPDEYEHVYEGMCRQSVTGAVYRNELLRAGFAGCHMTPASLLTPSGTWDISITSRSGWLSLSGLSSASLTSFSGASRAYSITYASFSPALRLRY